MYSRLNVLLMVWLWSQLTCKQWAAVKEKKEHTHLKSVYENLSATKDGGD